MTFIAETSTSLIFRPVSALSSSRRSVSISGSSAIVVLPQCAQRDQGRCLFGFLLRTAPTLAVLVVADHDRGEELLRVVGTFVAHDVLGPRVAERGRELLEPGLVVARAVSGRRAHDALLE